MRARVAKNALLTPRGKPFSKPGALSDHQRLIRQRGVTPLMYQYGETVIANEGDVTQAPPENPWPHSQKKPLRGGPGDGP